VGQLLREFGLTHTGGAREQEAADRAIDARQTRTPALDGAHDRLDRRILTEDDTLEFDLEVRESIPVGAARAQGRDVGHPRDHLLDVAHANRLALLARGAQSHGRTGLVHHVDRLVGQEVFRQVPAR